MIEQRAKEKSIEAGIGKYQQLFAFSWKIICGECGATFKRRQHYKPSGDYVAWCCNTHIADKDACSMMYIRDEDIKTAFLRMIRKLQTAHAKVQKPFVEGLKGTNNKERLRQVLTLEEQIEKNAEQIVVLTNLMSSGYIEPEIFQAEKNQLNLEADRLAREKQLISKNINGDLTHLDEAQKLLRFVSKKTEITKFEDEMFLEYVNTMTVHSRDEITFNLKCGQDLTERLVK